MKRNRTFTGKFKVGQQVRSAHPGENKLFGVGIVRSVDPNRKYGNTYQIEFEGSIVKYICLDEDGMIDATPTPTETASTYDFSESGLGIGRIADVDPVSEMLAEIEAAEISARTAPKREYKLCDCGHYSAWPMSTSSGVSCPDCYDRMSE